MYQIIDPKTKEYTTDYTKLALRTAAPANDQMQLMHAMMGLRTETDEILELFKAVFVNGDHDVNAVKVREEIGDVLWYMALAYHYLNAEKSFEQEFYEFMQAPMNVTWHETLGFVFDMNMQTAWMLDQVKRELIYNKPHEREGILENVRAILPNIALTMLYFEYDPQTAMQDNIFKLAKRYMGEGWTPEECFNRDTVNELSHIKL